MNLQPLQTLITSLESFNAHDEVVKIVEDNELKLEELQREQMLEGRGVDGEYIRPFYSENPYFKTPDAAKKYAAWKQRITPNPLRPLDVPNLTITGRFHGSLRADTFGDKYAFNSNDPNAGKIFGVHENAQGLNYDSRLEFAKETLMPDFKKVLKQKTGLII